MALHDCDAHTKHSFTQPGGGVMHMHTQACVCMCACVCPWKAHTHTCTPTHTYTRLQIQFWDSNIFSGTPYYHILAPSQFMHPSSFPASLLSRMPSSERQNPLWEGHAQLHPSCHSLPTQAALSCATALTGHSVQSEHLFVTQPHPLVRTVKQCVSVALPSTKSLTLIELLLLPALKSEHNVMFIGVGHLMFSYGEETVY